MRIEVFGHLILPFDMRSTGHYSEEPVSNVATESFGLILSRHVEGHRTVIFWKPYVEPFTFQNKGVNGVYFLEQSHVIIEPDQRTFSNEDPKFDALTDFVASSVFFNIMMRTEQVEDLQL
ncbi:Hypothetical protein PHPALM_1501 [Phytophthora palmivora]|uniref:Uncharacterized protein n=1 Tax=Phytophthora palmivora TaxID=4796 RepID=A0A2P4YS75_9STRA|nr:Hypothetical protein PHPALM_1501 [Phytophthora palmivora]